mgnify:CR=1 FL=1
MSLFAEADERWKSFLDKKIKDYGSKRNYDYGPLQESSVSKISPFISHRVLFEYQLIKEIKQKFKVHNVNKFIEEVYWRIYWKGCLENKPCIWENFIDSDIGDFDKEIYFQALNGKTNISYFNSWVKELKTYNYLHNHTRMWFASTWIFNLGLPWELGAKFFFKHLYDGDAASNLLSWRWVAGLQTKGKRYLFSPQNLKKFSNGRFCVDNISNKDIYPRDDFDLVLFNEIYQSDFNQSSDFLIMFDNDLHLDSLKNLIKNYKKVFLIFLDDDDRIIKISDSVRQFKQNLIKEFSKEFENVDLVSSKKLINKLQQISSLDLLYPSIGENYDFIKQFQKNNQVSFKKLVRPEDLYAWKFAKKGFFKFKENIPLINKFLYQTKLLWK